MFHCSLSMKLRALAALICPFVNSGCKAHCARLCSRPWEQHASLGLGFGEVLCSWGSPARVPGVRAGGHDGAQAQSSTHVPRLLDDPKWGPSAPYQYMTSSSSSSRDGQPFPPFTKDGKGHKTAASAVCQSPRFMCLLQQGRERVSRPLSSLQRRRLMLREAGDCSRLCPGRRGAKTIKEGHLLCGVD